MFQRSKSNFKIVAVCRNGAKEGRYTFIEDCDSTWSDIAEQLFRDEFGVNPSEMSLESREKV